MAPIEYAVVVNMDKLVSASRVRSYTNIEPIVIQMTALKEDDTCYVRKVDEVEKINWNTNRQRKLRHYPGRRWIDTRTTNK